MIKLGFNEKVTVGQKDGDNLQNKKKTRKLQLCNKNQICN